MPNCIIPGCAKEGTCLHQVELPGSEHLLCEGHYQLLFVSGMAGEEDLRVYNAAYQAILEQRRVEAKAKEAGLVELPDSYLAGTDMLLHGGPCARCGKEIVVQKGVPFKLRVGAEDGTRVCPECIAKEDAGRCAWCGWPLKDRPEDGCVRGNCSQRPLPDRLFDRARAERELSAKMGGDVKLPPEPAAENREETGDGQGPSRVALPHPESEEEAGQ